MLNFAVLFIDAFLKVESLEHQLESLQSSFPRQLAEERRNFEQIFAEKSKKLEGEMNLVKTDRQQIRERLSEMQHASGCVCFLLFFCFGLKELADAAIENLNSQNGSYTQAIATLKTKLEVARMEMEEHQPEQLRRLAEELDLATGLFYFILFYFILFYFLFIF
jgi:exonuclease VII large subunit